MDYLEFDVISPLDGKTCRCRFHKIMTGISLRHSDTVDVQFLVNGKRVMVALPHAALAECRRKGVRLTDVEVIEIAAAFLKQLLETGESAEGPFLRPSLQQVFSLASQIPAAAQQ